MTIPVQTLSNEILNTCTNNDQILILIKEILNKSDIIDSGGYVNVTQFAQWFTYKLEDFITSEYGSDEWVESYDDNFKWGEQIAIKINNLIKDLSLKE